MLHNIINFFVCFYALPLNIVIITCLLLSILEYTIAKRKNLNTFYIKINKLIGKGFTYNFFSKLISVYIINSIIFLLLSKTYFYNSNLSEISLTNNSLFIFICCNIIFYFIHNLLLYLRSISYKQNINLALVFTLSILVYIFFFNSFIVLFFFIEIINISIFLFILNSLTPVDSTTKKKIITTAYNINYKKTNTNYRYSIFVYYWLSFFFSIFFFLLLLSFSYQFNFIDIDTLIFMNYFSLQSSYILDIIAGIFILLITLKFGLPPFHFQKLSIYKGLPISLSLIYSIIIIIGYFFIIVNILFSLTSLFFHLKVFFKFLLLISIPLILIVLFKELNIKAFFGYSSILNISILFLILFLN